MSFVRESRISRWEIRPSVRIFSLSCLSQQSWLKDFRDWWCFRVTRQMKKKKSCLIARSPSAKKNKRLLTKARGTHYWRSVRIQFISGFPRQYITSNKKYFCENIETYLCRRHLSVRNASPMGEINRFKLKILNNNNLFIHKLKKKTKNIRTRTSLVFW